MKRKSLILSLVVALLFTIALSAHAKPYSCKLCGSWMDITTTEISAVPVSKYISCICNGYGHGTSSLYDKVNEIRRSYRDDCGVCGKSYYFTEYTDYERIHIGIIAE